MVSHKVIVQANSHLHKVLLNRPKKLNAINQSMAEEVLSQVSNTDKRLLVSSTCHLALSAGADLKALAENPASSYNFCRTVYRMLAKTFYLKQDTLSIWEGHVIGLGYGLGAACKLKVGVESTKWSMPEHLIGLVPNSTAGYFLSKLDPSWGLYLYLSSCTLKGVDCYKVGLTTHYLEKKHLQEFISRLENGEDFTRVCDHFHSEPKEDTFYDKNNEFIQEVFGEAKSIEEVVEKLNRKPTNALAQSTLKVMEESSPLTLKVAFEGFKKLKNLSYLEAIKHEANIDLKLFTTYRSNIEQAILSRIIQKQQTKPIWAPSTLEEVTEAMVKQVIKQDIDILAS